MGQVVQVNFRRMARRSFVEQLVIVGIFLLVDLLLALFFFL